MSILSKLREQRNAKAAEARKLVEDHPGDTWTEEQEKVFDKLEAEIKALDKEIERNVKATAMMGQPADICDGATITVVGAAGAEGRVYRNFGQQLIDVAAAANPEQARLTGVNPVQAMERLGHVQNASGAGTSVGSDGGYLVQSDFTTELLNLSHEQSMLYSRCRRIPIGPTSDRLEAPIVDETSRATGSRWGGVQVYRAAEAATVTASKPKFAKLVLELEKLFGLCYVSNEGLKDAVQLSAIISQAFSEEFGFKLDDEIIRGTGSGECLGILNAAGLVSQAKETGQAADTIVAENIMKMFARMPARFIGNAEWYINQECLPQLFKLSVAVGTGGIPVFLPPGGLSSAPYGMLLGRPVTPIEQASALGDVGDIMFASFMQYLLIEKGGMEAAESIHVKFIYDENAFRFLVRNNGTPLWKSALTPYKGANTLSPFVALAAR